MVPRRDPDACDIEIAFVNNMPDSAFEETERQFMGLVESAAGEMGDVTVRFSRYSLPGLRAARRSNGTSPGTTDRLTTCTAPAPTA